jgi:hypothetical protein
MKSEKKDQPPKKQIVIKFSHRYDKLPYGFEWSRLLDVIKVKLEDLSNDFIFYDTHYSDDELSDGFYPLPSKGDYMILLLQVDDDIIPRNIWTTIRSQKGRNGIDKLAYYRSHIGQVVRCEVTE